MFKNTQYFLHPHTFKFLTQELIFLIHAWILTSQSVGNVIFICYCNISVTITSTMCLATLYFIENTTGIKDFPDKRVLSTKRLRVLLFMYNIYFGLDPRYDGLSAIQNYTIRFKILRFEAIQILLYFLAIGTFLSGSALIVISIGLTSKTISTTISIHHLCLIHIYLCMNIISGHKK